MAIQAGHHRESRAMREAAVANGMRLEKINNNIDETGREIVSCDGAEGTLFIFDTDLPHKAGHVRPGKRGLIMRGHTRSAKVLRQMGINL